EARKMLVGKTGFGPSCTQEDINSLMVSLAKQGKRVIRLKGGDPLIFGRAAEEIAACEAASIAVDVVPGITSVQGAAARLGIALTDRKKARRLQYVTGHAKQGGLPADVDWKSLADPSTTTAVFLPTRTRGAASVTEEGVLHADADAGRAGRESDCRRPRPEHASDRDLACHPARSGCRHGTHRRACGATRTGRVAGARGCDDRKDDFFDRSRGVQTIFVRIIADCYFENLRTFCRCSPRPSQPPRPHAERPQEGCDGHRGKHRSYRPAEERKDAAVGLDERSHEALLHHRSHDDAEHHGRYAIAVALHDIADDAESGDGDDCKKVV